MAKALLQKDSLMLPGTAGNLECLLEVPANHSQGQVALLCHPHPLYEGTMHNKVVHTLARAMHELGVPTLRFNFRGVGDSEGSYADGIGETDDTVALAAWLQQEFAGADLWLAGFSFGGMVAALAAAQTDAKQLVTVAPAVGMIDSNLASMPEAAWLLIQGQQDELLDVQEVVDWAAKLSPPPEVVIMPEATHFFHGQLVVLRKLLVERLAASVG